MVQLLQGLGRWPAWLVAHSIPGRCRSERGALISDEAVQARLQNSSSSTPYEIVHRNLYVTHQRVAWTFRQGRVLLAGDAAHVNNPIGGMGLNGGLQMQRREPSPRNSCAWPQAARPSDSRSLRFAAPHGDERIVQQQSIANKQRLEASDAETRQRNLDELAYRRRSGTRAAIPAALFHDRKPAPRRRADTGGCAGMTLGLNTTVIARSEATTQSERHLRCWIASLRSQ